MKIQRTSHFDLAVAPGGVKIGLWSPVDAVCTLWFCEAVYRAGRRMSSYGPFNVAASSSTRIRFVVPVAISAGDHSLGVRVKEDSMLAESHDEEQIIARVAALDIAKAELVCCVRVPSPGGV